MYFVNNDKFIDVKYLNFFFYVTFKNHVLKYLILIRFFFLEYLVLKGYKKMFVTMMNLHIIHIIDMDLSELVEAIKNDQKDSFVNI